MYIETLQHTLANKEVDILDLGKEVATLQTKLRHQDELLAMERERMQKLEQEVARLEQDRTGSNLRSAVQEILHRVSTESVSKAGTPTKFNPIICVVHAH
jgi:hypothetical protein